MGLIEFAEDVIGLWRCPIGDETGVETGELVAKVFDFRAGFLTVFFDVLMEVFDRVEQDGLDLDTGGKCLDCGVELLELTGERLDRGPPRTDAGNAQDELPGSDTKGLEGFLEGGGAHGLDGNLK